MNRKSENKIIKNKILKLENKLNILFIKEKEASQYIAQMVHRIKLIVRINGHNNMTKDLIVFHKTLNKIKINLLKLQDKIIILEEKKLKLEDVFHSN